MALLHEQLAPFSKHKGGVGPHARISRCNSVLGKNFSGHFEIFILFSSENTEKICMKCQSLFSGKNKKSISIYQLLN